MRSPLFLYAIGLGLVSLMANTPILAQAVPAESGNSGDQIRQYRINPGDVVEVYVWGDERLQRSVKILPDGTFSFPLVGQIQALNKTPHDIEGEISIGLKPQYRDTVPQVTVSVKEAAGLQFTVSGKVKSPGAFTPGRYVNVLEALAMAGGPSDFANLSEVTILRKTGGRLTAIKVKLNDFLKGNPTPRDLGDLPQLASGDQVIIP